MIQESLVESTIGDLHGYEPILLIELDTEKQIAIIKGKNGITPKTKNYGWRNCGCSGAADADAAVEKPRMWQLWEMSQWCMSQAQDYCFC